MDKTEPRQEQHNYFQKNYKILQKGAGEGRRDVVNNTRTTMQNLAIIVSAFAGAALLILASEIPKVDVLIISGIVILMFEAVWIFWHLFRRDESQIAFWDDMEKGLLRPLGEMVKLYEQAEQEKITWEEYDEKISEKNKELTVKQTGALSPDGLPKRAQAYGRYRLNTKPFSICVWITAIGFSSLALGLIIPHLPLPILYKVLFMSFL